jgi:CarD family transcriptional regulator, regulator of rRNA transcription
MNFNLGDRVVHHTFGIGMVVSIELMNFATPEPRDFYRVDFNKTTIWIEVAESSKSRLRLITPKSHLAQYRAVLKSSPVCLDHDFRKRQVELQKRMDAGSFKGLCEVTRDLNALNITRPLSFSEKKLLEETREALALEWSTASETTQKEALSEINGCLYKGRQGARND